LKCRKLCETVRLVSAVFCRVVNSNSQSAMVRSCRSLCSRRFWKIVLAHLAVQVLLRHRRVRDGVNVGRVDGDHPTLEPPLGILALDEVLGVDLVEVADGGSNISQYRGSWSTT
jgi:hypothetical protein